MGGLLTATAVLWLAAAPDAGVDAGVLPVVELLPANAPVAKVDGGTFGPAGFARSAFPAAGYKLDCGAEAGGCSWKPPKGAKRALELPGDGQGLDGEDLLFPPQGQRGLLAVRENTVAALGVDGAPRAVYALGTRGLPGPPYLDAAFEPERLVLEQEATRATPRSVFKLSLARLFEPAKWLAVPVCGKKPRELSPIPRVELAPEVLSESWRKDRRLLVRSQCTVKAEHRGKARIASAANLKAVMVGDSELWVDVWVNTKEVKAPASGPKAWQLAPHLEVWVTPPDRPCEKAAMVQWGVTLADGEVHEGYGNPKQSFIAQQASWVEPTSGDIQTRFKLRLPFAPAGLTVSLVEADGTKPLQVTSTSPVVAGDPGTLGRVVEVARGAPGPSCVPSRDGLVLAPGALLPRWLLVP